MNDDLRPIRDLVLNRRAHRAFDALGIVTIADFRSTPLERLMAVRGVGERTLADIERALDQEGAAEPSPLARWIDDLPLAECGLSPEVVATLADQGVHGLLDLIARPDQAVLDDTTDSVLRAALHRATSRSSRATGGESAPRDRVTAVLGVLDPMHRAVVDQHLGRHGRPRCPTALARRTGRPLDEVRTLLADAAERLAVADCGDRDLLLDDAVTELERGDGVVDQRSIGVHGPLGRAVAGSPRPDVPLRLIAFCRPDRFTFDAGRLLDLPESGLGELVRSIRKVILERGLPCAVRTLARCGPEDRLGVVRHVVERHLQLALRFHPRRGPLVVRRRGDVASRLERILDGLPGPAHVDDLLFHYRDHHGCARRHRILEALRTDTRFLEVGPRCFDLRIRHLDELELARPVADLVRDRVVRGGERVAVRSPGDLDAPSERTAWLVIDLLRHDRTVRHLGRGEFCPRHANGSPIVLGLVEDLRRAMGEVPLSRFLQNQDPRQRRLVSRLLRENRRFVSPGKDRVDLLENYPFNPERIRLLLREVSACLHEHDGFAAIGRVHAAVQAAGLGGVFLTEHLLTDLLRRHGHFEFLPGGFLADPELGLGNWIQSTSRDAIRRVGRPLSAEQILAECPELAQFRVGLEAMLELDPLIQAADGLHYQMV